MNYKNILFKFVLIAGLLSVPASCWAMPPGTLLYRTSGNGKMFGYSGDPLIYSEKGIVKDIYSGHAAIYIGKENGEDYIVEAMGGGVVKNPARYFVNRADGETFLGARIPSSLDAIRQARIVALAKSLAAKSLGYDFDFHKQKGPGDKEWTCVGLTEKLYESADIANPNNLGALEYDPAYYAIDITPDGFDNRSVTNPSGDCFSKDKEFSKIARRKDILVPAPELVGYDVGLEKDGERYIFLPYTQFLQPSLAAVAADIEVSSYFSRQEVNGPLNAYSLAARWSLINNPLSSLKIAGKAVKEAAGAAIAKTKEIAKSLGNKIFGSDEGTAITLIDSNLPQKSSSTASKKAVSAKKKAVTKKTAVAKPKASKKASSTAKQAKSKTAKADKGISVKVKAEQSAELEVKAGKVADIKVSTKKSQETAAAIRKASTTKISASKTDKADISVVAAVNNAKATTSIHYSPTVSTGASAVIHNGHTSSGSSSSGTSGGSSSGNSPANNTPDYPKLANINAIYSTGNNDWVELINTTDHDFDLAAAGYRLEKTKSAEDPSLLIRIGDIDDGTYPGGTVIKAHGTYLIASNGANAHYRQKADALVSREGFGWPGSGYTLYLGTGAISSSTDTDIVDAVGFGEDATYFLGSGPAMEIKDNYVLRRASSSDDNAKDFKLVLSDDPSIAVDAGGESAATSTPVTATTTDAVSDRLMLIRKIYGTGDNDWVELFNPTDKDIDLMSAGYRIEKAVSAADPALLMRIGNADDGIYPGGTTVKAHDSYMIVRDDASGYYRNQADAIATKTDFSWAGNGYSLYLGVGAISSSTDADIVDLVGFGQEAAYYQGSGPAPAIMDGYILNRIANTHSNSTDFNLIASDDPEEAEPEKEDQYLFVPPTPVVSEGLTDIWHFDECYGEGDWTVGRWDCARMFGYYQEPMAITLDPAVDMNDGFAMSFYYKQQSIDSQVKAILSNSSGKRFSVLTGGGLLEIEGLPNSKFRYYQGIPGDDKWHKLTLSINQAADYWEVYIDSTLIAHEVFMERLPVMTDLEIKGDNLPVMFDELALWNRPLTAAEIKADLVAGAPYSPITARPAQKAPKLLNFWSFEEDDGQQATDSIGGDIINLLPSAWVGRSHDNYAIRTIPGGGFHSGDLEDFPQTQDMSMAFWWRNRSSSAGQANIYLTGGEDGQKNLFALLADNFRLDYWFNNQYGIMAEGTGKTIPADDAWHYLAFAYDSYRYKLSFYVDGEEKASSSLIWMPEEERITGLKIASDDGEAEIDDLSLWSGALSPKQVKEIYTNNK